MADIPTTQRAYTLRLRGESKDNQTWRNVLWHTHVAVNRGAKAFGDWLLTLRGGLCHTLAERDDPEIDFDSKDGKELITAIQKELKKKKQRGDPDPTQHDAEAEALRQRTERIANRRILLALSWLNVEDANGAPSGPLCVATGIDSQNPRSQKVIAEFHAILKLRQQNDGNLTDDVIGNLETAPHNQPGTWIGDCAPSLAARIREDAVWVNRSRAFDEAVIRVGTSLTREEVWDVLGRFFKSEKTYFGGVEKAEENNPEGEPSSKTSTDDKVKDLVQDAAGWLCDRAGAGDGVDFDRLATNYHAIGAVIQTLRPNKTGTDTIDELVAGVQHLGLKSNDLKGVLSLVGATGHKSATRNKLKVLEGIQMVTDEHLTEIATLAFEDSKTCLTSIGMKGVRPWASAMIADVENAAGFTYLNAPHAARHGEFSVILDHAARRLCQSHSWIKLAEGRRREFEEDARKLDRLKEEHPQVVAWLDNFCRERSEETGALDDEGYRIRKRAITDWDDVVKKWGKLPACLAHECEQVRVELGIGIEGSCDFAQTCLKRIQAAREVQCDPENDKPGDIQLYEALATDDAKVVWLFNGRPNTQPLKDYVAAKQAGYDKRRFKVPAYRHPDELRHPVFCDFGKSRWDISFAVHRAVMQRETLQAKVQRQHADVVKATQAIAKAKTDEKKATAQQKLDDTQRKLAESRQKLDWLESAHGLEMTLWDGHTLETVPLTWQSKRLVADLALRGNSDERTGAPVAVTRANRLGLASADAKADSRISLLGLLDADKWNGRLQAPRAELDAIAAVRDGEKCKGLSPEERRQRVNKMIAKLHWLVSFSAKLQPQGPWFEFTKTLPQDVNYSIKRSRLYYDINKERKYRAQLILSRLPGLRLLSVDLGHRYAAACAVWEALSTEQIQQACRAAGCDAPSRVSLHWTVPHGEKGRTIYRRVADDVLPDGSTHPAPWARLDRQFLIKLQGEDQQARAANSDERADVEKLERELGDNRRERNGGKEWRDGFDWLVDELMSDAVRTVRLALRNHSDYARIARDLASITRPLSGGRASAELKGDELTKHLVDVLVRWHGLATSTRWRDLDGFARRTWDDAKLPKLDSLPKLDDELTGPTRKKRRTDIERALQAAATELANRERVTLSACWHTQWLKHDEAWLPRLKWLNRWIAPRGKKHGRTIRRAGGLSLKRIATFTSLYQVQKAFFTRLRPDGEKPVTAGEGFGQRLLNARNQMRENRVKQLASRIAEAALGIGIEQRRGEHGKQLKRPRQRLADPRFAPCHAVVIENLTRYRPDELQTRRENRQLMSWSSAQVKKYLGDHCQLYGLYLREVSPAYTSRQDSRTGSPGVRCVDVPVSEFAKRFSRQLASVVKENKKDALSLYLLSLKKTYLDDAGQPKPEHRDAVLRVPYRGGEIFVSANGESSIANGLQADLNAAANIGLKSLLDPDWPGAWWYVPAVPQTDGTFVPKTDSTTGSYALDGKSLSLEQSSQPASAGKSKDVVNLWRDVSGQAVNLTAWRVYSHYQNVVMLQVIAQLRKKFGANQ